MLVDSEKSVDIRNSLFYHHNTCLLAVVLKLQFYQFSRVKHLMKEIHEEEGKTMKRSLKRLQKSLKKFELPRRVGRNKFTNEDAIISEVPELTGSLREVIPQGNILRDELLSLQKRNLIEVSKPQFK